jgi:porphobilinogen synthase
MAFPQTRARRMRATPAVRRMIRETELTPNDLIQPFFVRPGKNERRPVRSMPGVFQLSIDQVLKDARVVAKLGVPAIILFGIPEKKDAAGREAYDSDGIVQRAVRAVKDALPELLVITDLCLCEYTDHGHCGVLRPRTWARKSITMPLELLGRTALVQAEAGADWVAPSGMMDGAVA